MRAGTALFDAVAISDTRAEVRAGRGGDVVAGVGGRSAGPIAIVVAASAVQDGGVVWMSGGAVTFKGGNISNSKVGAVRAHMLRWHVPLRQLQR